ncbi:response regulator [Alteraurantiacibacter palmitatis]|uniref:Response regulator n=1 Tax=Alteraurantiacibacter palmitatis TaxID=2054628 RepID=A0ABV7E9T7_9SPHN
MSKTLPGHGETVLVIDDEPGTLSVITASLEAAGISVLVATSGEDGLRLLDHILPDLIIVDARMPGMDGFATTRQIKQSPTHAQVPVIFMTGLTESEHVVEALQAGGVDYLRKPVNLDELLARVRVQIAQGRAAQASLTSLDATGRLMLATDAAGKMLWCTPRAEEALVQALPGWQRGTPFPDVLRAAIERLLVRGSAGVGASVSLRPADTGGTGTLELVLVARCRRDEMLIRLNVVDAARDAEVLAERLGLTAREAQVLLWVSYGKSSADISEVLGISPRTVQKHLEHLYIKLGVETRSAAAAVAVRAMEA